MLTLRRVVTGNNTEGKSMVLFDGPPTRTILDRVAELWFTESTPADNTSVVDAAIGREPSMQPPPGGTVFRYVVVPPEQDRATSEAMARVSLATLNAEHARVDTSRHPGMHRTDTIDYIVLLSGRLTMLLDEGEVDLEPFDLVVQRSANHAWINSGAEPAVLLAVNIDAKPI